jgi:hypothetical protein
MQVQPLTIRNVSKLPLTCQLRVAPPFSLDKGTLQLGRFEGATLNVSFDPAFRMDQKSGVVKQKLQVSALQIEAHRGALVIDPEDLL